ncbi:MAG: M20 family metallo-hydrolase [Ferruginibacter sp.]|nr:M20 family metallo-hydrolase [Ferruginibacter sp.]
MTDNKLYQDAVELLKKLIATPSFSKEEGKTAGIIEQFFSDRNIPSNRLLNNVWCLNKYFDPARPTILLNSHHDTVKPNAGYTKDPFAAIIEDEKLYGLGSNDAGGCLVSLITAFCHFYEKKNLKFNIVIAATAEEEISGSNGVEKLLASTEFSSPILSEVEGRALGGVIVGEPTLTNLAIAEKGLLVLDCISTGKAGHAAREEGDNAIYKAMQDIEWFKTYRFPKVSETLGPVKMSVTSINTENKAHNVVPATCSFVVDIRVTDEYTHEEILEIVKQNVQSEINPRSMRLRSSKIEKGHPLVQAGLNLGKQMYGSPTTSDAALIPAPVLKCGPGDSARSHTADEFIYLKEIEEGINTYIKILEQVV